MDGRREKTRGKRHEKREDGHEAPTNPETPKIAGKPPETRRGREGLSYGFQDCPADTLTSDFVPPEL